MHTSCESLAAFRRRDGLIFEHTMRCLTETLHGLTLSSLRESCEQAFRLLIREYSILPLFTPFASIIQCHAIAHTVFSLEGLLLTLHSPLSQVESSQAFLWLSQLRHRWGEEKHCFANICDAQFLYSYEYLGNTPRLVITPLTDR